MLALVGSVMVTKAVVIAALARGFGSPNRRALQMGLILAQGGEFGFVLFASAQRGLLISPEAAQLFGAVVTITMALTPLVAIAAARLNPKPSVETRDGPETAEHIDGPGAARWWSASGASGRRCRRCSRRAGWW